MAKPAKRVISIRSTARGEINDFLELEGKQCKYSNAVLSGLVGKLWGYKEEGREISPTIVYLDSIESFGRRFPGFSWIEIGSCEADENAAKAVLKDCAPLTGESSFIYIQRDQTEAVLVYGVFSYLRTPTSMDIVEAVSLDDSIFAILLRRATPMSVDLMGCSGRSLSILFSTLREEDSSDTEIHNFISDIVSDVEGIDDRLRKYLHRIVSRSLSSCHGSILVCAKASSHPDVVEICDAIVLSQPIDFATAFNRYLVDESAAALMELQRSEELLTGFLSCDGMIVFSSDGKVLSYRVFYKPVAEQASSEKIVGGARRRAFSGVCSIGGGAVKSALFRSQDGSMEYKGVSK